MQVAAVQMASGPNVSANLTEAARLIDRAATAGAALVVLPENFALMPMREADRLQIAETEGEGPIQGFLAQQARTYGIWLVAGTIPLRAEQPNKVRAACLLLNDKGELVARYDKMHLFDVALENGERYNESKAFEPGNKTVVVDTPLGRLGLAVCYDLRFPELFRRMLDDGAEVFTLPSAFTAVTGKAHWEVLVRARAIENLAYVIAAAQGGYHVNGRETFGDSMIVNPWGEVLDRLARGSGFVIAEFDRKRLRQVRDSLPSIHHRRIYADRQE
ncbi:MAG TPA: carbon-nitrogen hydrolase family protein [Acidiferrobacterales bacterium]|nr:carbon-nitrogen hydrolase family protein [Acidiferrobacterales bacterium]